MLHALLSLFSYCECVIVCAFFCLFFHLQNTNFMMMILILYFLLLFQNDGSWHANISKCSGCHTSKSTTNFGMKSKNKKDEALNK